MDTRPARYFDSNELQGCAVQLNLDANLEILSRGRVVARWPYADIRRLDAGDGILRLGIVANLAVVRLEIADPAVQQAVIAVCPSLYGETSIGTVSNRQIAGWSLAVVAMLAAAVFFGLPLLAEQLVWLIPHSVEKRIGDLENGQILRVFAGKPCANADGLAAFAKMMAALESKAGLPYPPEPVVLSSNVPNAFALPGGGIYLLDGLLAKADSPDEIAGVLAHELGHVAHRDGLRQLVQNGGVSLMASLVLGDIAGAGAALALGRNLVEAHYSRAAETAADAFAADVMGRLGRSSKPMGALLERITGPETRDPLAIFASHPLTADRMAAFAKAPAAGGPEILNANEWHALKYVCK